ncbi:MAG: ABC transporter permease [Gemmataceae bacterium]|nr:ABC transporter permease [Gemmataceae bacterium]
MTRVVGILAVVLALYGLLMMSDPQARSLENHINLGRRIGEWGILTLGVGFVIITGGIDLSIGSVVCLSAVSFGLLLENGMNPYLATLLVLAGSALIGLFHGVLVARWNLQPFIVTLCGLFIYRGIAQLLTLVKFKELGLKFSQGWDTPGRILRDSSRDVGLPDKPVMEPFFFLQRGNLPLGDWLGLPEGLRGWFNLPMPLVLLLVLAVLTGVFLHMSVYGRRLYALGYNEQAARFAGIRTVRYKILSYVLCSTLAGLGGLIFLLKVRSAAPSNAGSWFELYAITGAVLGGFSLRGGEGMVIGILLGTSILPLLRSYVIFRGIPSDLEFTVIGTALLLGTIADEMLRRGPGKWLNSIKTWLAGGKSSGLSG